MTLEEELRELIITWRSYANGDYCQTYNNGMAQGLRCAADNLENSLDHHAAQPTLAVDDAICSACGEPMKYHVGGAKRGLCKNRVTTKA